jgi:hypothetical protein
VPIEPAERIVSRFELAKHSSCVQAKPLHLRPRDDRQVRSPQRRSQEGLGGTDTYPPALIHLEAGTAGVVAPVEVLDPSDTRFKCGFTECVEDFPGQSLLLDAPFAACAVHVVATAPVVLTRFEDGKHIAPRPTIIAGEGGPFVVVAGLPAQVEHRVDRR